MWKEKPTGIKILWVWTIGTAAVLLTCVSRTRMRDMETLLNQPPQQQQQQHQQQQQKGISSVDHVMVDDSSSPSVDNIIRDD
ncbi:hypothetical protein SOVF_112520 [Spinacia oleracea]|uniref:Transmembrane protein n=1 Tax=Spinacia oleracea TaxID=3562 RepID=A0A9R0IMF5_SPIOL|nr:uncharacterized protein LOC110791417 [Spinacia oleracea]KNA13891.1 hypothetical protein SOVF_112520 [Spinacia oleracea]